MNRYKLRKKEDQESIVVTRGTVQELPPQGSDAGGVRGGAGLVKADGGAEPPRKIHLLRLGSLDESMDLGTGEQGQGISSQPAQQQPLRSTLNPPGAMELENFTPRAGNSRTGKASQRNPATEHLQHRNGKDVTQPLEVKLWKMSAWALKGFL